MKIKSLIKIDFTELLVFNFVITFFLYIILRAFIPISYSVLNHMLGPPGSFDDFVNQINKVDIYPIVPSSYIAVPTIQFIYKSLFGLSREFQTQLFLFISIIFIIILQYITKIKNLYLLFFSYPLLFSYYRGSNDHLVVLALCISLFYFEKGYKTKSYVFFIISTLLKPAHNFIYGLLALRNVNAFNIIKFSLLMASVLIINLFFVYLNPPVGFEKISVFFKSLKLHYFEYAIGDGGLLFNNSIYGLLKITLGINFITNYGHYFSIILIALCLLISVCFILKLFDIFTTSLLISIAVIFFTPVSPDYRLSFLIIPIYLSLISTKNYCNYFYSIILIFIIMLPKHFYIFTNSFGNVYTIQSIINPILSIILIIVLFYENKKIITNS